MAYLEVIKKWLWNRRQPLIIAGLLWILFQLIFNLWVFLWWWIPLLVVMVILGSLWIHQELDRDFFVSTLENLWLTAVFFGVIVFAVSNLLAFNLLALIFAGIVFYLFRAQQDFRREDSWLVRDISTLQVVDLVGFFLAAAFTFKLGLVSAWPAMLLIGAFGVIALIFSFWRTDIGLTQLSLYAAVLFMLLFELSWFLIPWDQGDFFRAFLLTLAYFLVFEMSNQYEKGSLTLRVVTEYAVTTLVIITVLFVVNTFFGLI